MASVKMRYALATRHTEMRYGLPSGIQTVQVFMKIIPKPPMWYRRYRHENRYDSPMLLFIGDALFGLLAPLLLVLPVALVSIGVMKHFNNNGNTEPATMTVAATTSIASPSTDESKAVTPAIEIATDKSSTDESSPVIAAIATTPAKVASKTVAPEIAPVEPAAKPAVNKAIDDVPLVSVQATASTQTTDTNQPASDIDLDDVALPVVTANVIQSNANDNNQPTLVDEKWLNKLDPDAYIIQFGAAVDQKLFDEFIPVIDGGEPIAIYPYRVTESGRPIYGIATGVFQNGFQAKTALKNLTPEALAYTPWVRSVAALKQNIESTKLRTSQ